MAPSVNISAGAQLKAPLQSKYLSSKGKLPLLKRTYRRHFVGKNFGENISRQTEGRLCWGGKRIK